ncbi:hypothetical protein ACIBQ1_09460 [Nonomuraea sp. NPDC050153]|uniref:hypothetical protein n=1 Tax=Nonomuraea sp. NPDC050153 TaxID=3364359 RepID=UPI00379407F1
MLDDAQRVANYQAQSGGTSLTDRQHRRVNKKRRHQSWPATDRRAEKSAARAKVREERQRAALLPTP